MSASCEFKNQLVGEVHIPTLWRKDITTAEKDTQTSALRTDESGAQTTVSSMQAVGQLDKSEGTEQHQTKRARLQGLQYVYDGNTHDEDQLAAFLERSKDEILSILYKNTRSTAFDNYDPNWHQQSTELSSVYTLSSPHAVEGELHALDLSWSASGTMLAVAYGRIDTSGWCYSNGYVCVWGLARPDIDDHAPLYTLETDSYATCVAFHPINNYMLVVGTYSGEVVVFPNVTEDVPTEYSTNNCTSFTHQGPMSVLQWAQNLQEHRDTHRYVLCTASQDGHMACWTPANKLAQPVALHVVRNKRHSHVGIEAASYSRSKAQKGAYPPSVDGSLILGLESGDVGRARTGVFPTDGGDLAGAAPTALPLELDWLEGHRGPVQSVSTSPFFRHLFMTCSSDGCAHLYSDMERSPVLTLEPSAETKHFLYAAEFSPFRPSVVAVVSRSAFLHIYDLQHTQSAPLYSTEAGVDGAAVVSLSFNENSADLLATGDTRGCVRVWRLPSKLSQTTELERAAIRAGANVGTSKTDVSAAHGDDDDGAEGPHTRGGNDAIRQLFGFAL